MSDVFIFAEFLVLHGLVIAWCVWEYRKTDALHKKTLEEERMRQQQEEIAD